MSNFFVAITFPFRGLAYFLGRPPLWKYAAGAVAIQLGTLAIFIALYVAYRADLVEWITPDRFWDWAQAASRWILSAVILVGALFASLLTGNLLSLPIYDALTERILKDLGETLPEGRGLRRALLRSLLNQFLKILIFGTIQVALLLLYITPLAFLHPPISAFIGILFLGFEYLDYSLDARQVPVPERLSWMLRHTGSVLGYGSVLFLVLLIPFLGTLLLPLTVAGAALLAHHVDSPHGVV